MSTPLFGNNVQHTANGAQILDGAVGTMKNIAMTVDDAVMQLTGHHMVSSSGKAYGNAISQWLADFGIIQQRLAEMADLLGGTAQQITQNEDINSMQPSAIIQALQSAGHEFPSGASVGGMA